MGVCVCVSRGHLIYRNLIRIFLAYFRGDIIVALFSHIYVPCVIGWMMNILR